VSSCRQDYATTTTSAFVARARLGLDTAQNSLKFAFERVFAYSRDRRCIRYISGIPVLNLSNFDPTRWLSVDRRTSQDDEWTVRTNVALSLSRQISFFLPSSIPRSSRSRRGRNVPQTGFCEDIGFPRAASSAAKPPVVPADLSAPLDSCDSLPPSRTYRISD